MHLTGEARILEMKVEVLYFEGCPNHLPTVEKVREALESDYQSAEIREVEVRTQAEAKSLGFLGSPSVRIDDWISNRKPAASRVTA